MTTPTTTPLAAELAAARDEIEALRRLLPSADERQAIEHCAKEVMDRGAHDEDWRAATLALDYLHSLATLARGPAR